MYMKNIILLLIFNFISFNCSSQNLVPNPSFEQYDPELYLPEYTMQFGFEFTAISWSNALYTPGYVSPHNDTIGLNYYGGFFMTGYYPDSTVVVFPPKTGDHFVMMIHSMYQTSGELYKQTREYTSCLLEEPLVEGEEYCISFFVRKGPGCSASIDQIGAVLSNVELVGGAAFFDPFEYTGSPNNLIKNFQSKLITPVGELVSNENEWMQYSGSFIAEGGEISIALGCFIDDDELIYDYDNLCTHSSGLFMFAPAVYGYDDISVYKCDEPTYPANAGADICLKEGQSLQLGTSDLEDYFYEWSVSGEVISTEGMPWVSPDSTTIYGLHQKDFAFNETWSEISVVIIVGDEECILSIEDKLLSEINFYPNPSTGIYRIESPYLIESLELYNLLGELINKTTIHSQEYELNIQNQADGIYFVKMIIGEETVWKKLIKESRY